MNNGEGILIVYAKKKAKGEQLTVWMRSLGNGPRGPYKYAQVQETQEHGRAFYKAVFRHLPPGEYVLMGGPKADVGGQHSVFANEETVVDFS